MYQHQSRFEYHWRGTTIQGQSLEGHIRARNKNIASILLYQQGITIRHLKRVRYLRPKTSRKKMTILFFKQLSVLLKANLILMHALETMKHTHHLQSFRQLITQIQDKLQKGLPFSKVLELYPQYFTPLMCQLIAIGEHACQFDRVIFKIAHYEERQLELARRLYLLFAYPICITITTLCLIVSLCVFVLPHFLSFYHAFKIELPTLTKYFISQAKFIQTYGTPITILFFLFIVCARLCYQRFFFFRKNIDTYILQIPYLGSYLSKLMIVNICDALHLTLSGGLPLSDALGLIATLIKNTTYQEALMHTHKAVQEGSSLHQAMRLTRRFPIDFIEMITIGEESGKLSDIFSETAEHFEHMIHHHTLLCCKLLEPLLMIILGLMIGGFLLALYLPIFQLGAAF